MSEPFEAPSTPPLLYDSDRITLTTTSDNNGTKPITGTELPLDLSPTTLLEAFTSDKKLPLAPDKEDRPGTKLKLDETTSAERALVINAASIAKQLKSWYAEVEQWPWTGQFESRSDNKNENAPNVSSSDTDGYEPTVPMHQVQDYEATIEQLNDGIEKLDIEELKKNVLSLHSSRSRPNSISNSDDLASNSGRKPLYIKLDDISAVVTSTVLKTLPHLSMLRHQLDSWSARTAVFALAPEYLAGLRHTKEAVELGWKALAQSANAGSQSEDSHALPETIATIRSVLHREVSKLARQLDNMLDALEGQEDVLPDRWIEQFEDLEIEYSKWSVEAQKLLTRFQLGHLVKVSDSASAATTSETGKDKERSNEGPHDRIESETWPRPSRYGDDSQTQEDTHEGPAADSKPITSEEYASSSNSEIDTQNAWSTSEERSPSLLASVISPSSSASVDFDATAASHSASWEPCATISEALTPTSDEIDSDHSISRSHLAATTRCRSHSESTKVESPDSRFMTLETQSSSPVSSVMDDSPSIRPPPRRPLAQVPAPPLNAAMIKRRQKGPLERQLQPRRYSGSSATPITSNAHHTVLPESKMNATNEKQNLPLESGLQGDDLLEKQITSILDTIPANIRLTTRSKLANANNAASKAKTRPALKARNVGGPAMTLAPAYSQDTTRPKQQGLQDDEQGVKLYHLSQPGKERPIKLFVRLVGERGERVMVRVGGGWADLAEYLRQYAGHHGHRAVSDTRLEIHGVSHNVSTTPLRPSLKLRSSSTALSAKERPRSSQSTKESLAGYEATRVEIQEDRSTPVMTSSRRGSLSDNVEDIDSVPTSPVTPTVAAANSLASRSGTSSGRSGTTPASVGTNDSRVSWSGSEVGLGGTLPRKLDLSGEKAEWVDEMIGKARLVGKGSDGNFGDLGKVGGTKRVWLRTSSGAAG